MNLRHQLHNIQKDNLSMQEYLQQFKLIVDQLGAAGSLVIDDELFFAMLDGLSPSFGAVSDIIRYRAQTFSTTLEEAESLLLSEELTMNRQSKYTADLSAFNVQRQFKNKRPMSASSRNDGRPPNQQSSSNNSSHSDLKYNNDNKQLGYQTGYNPKLATTGQPLSTVYCQICWKRGHEAIDCYQRMNHAYKGRHPPEKLAAMAASSFLDDSTWYSYIGATHHITGDLENVKLSSKYDGNDSVRVGNGQGLLISNIGTGILPTPTQTFKLTHTLHCPQATSNLLSISRFTKDNNCHFIFTDKGFFMKDNQIGKTLHQGKLDRGLPVSCQQCWHSSTCSLLYCFQ